LDRLFLGVIPVQNKKGKLMRDVAAMFPLGEPLANMHFSIIKTYITY
jgi:hypothetical protein